VPSPDNDALQDGIENEAQGEGSCTENEAEREGSETSLRGALVQLIECCAALPSATTSAPECHKLVELLDIWATSDPQVTWV